MTKGHNFSPAAEIENKGEGESKTERPNRSTRETMLKTTVGEPAPVFRLKI